MGVTSSGDGDGGADKHRRGHSDRDFGGGHHHGGGHYGGDGCDHDDSPRHDAGLSDGGATCDLTIEEALRRRRVTMTVNPRLVSLTRSPEHAFLADESGIGADFTVGHIAYYTNSPQELAALLSRWNGRIVDTIPVSSVVPEAGYLIAVDLSRVRNVGRDEIARAVLMDDPCEQEHGQVSSTAGLATLVVAARERARGVRVDLDFHDVFSGIPEGSVLEAPSNLDPPLFNSPTSPMEYNTNVFTWDDYRPATIFGQPDTGVTRAWQVHASTNTPPNIVVGIIDGGFLSNTSSDNAVPVAFVNGRRDQQNRARCTGGSTCPWHGTQVMLSITGALDNGFGGAGVGTPAVSTVLVNDSDLGHFDVLRGLSRLVDFQPGADIINISFGGFRSGIAWAFMWNYRLTFNNVIDEGVLVVAAAGNENKDLDDTKSRYVPCEVDGVLCVGAMNDMTTTRAIYGTAGQLGSNYGSPVDVFAPHPRIAKVSSEVPGSLENAENTFGGTSGSAPYVSGVAALVWSVNVQQSGSDVQRIIRSTSHIRATDVRVRREGVVNAYDAIVESAGRNVPPTIRISPGTGTTISDIRMPPTFVATVSDIDGDPLTIYWVVDGEDTGVRGAVLRPDSSVFPEPGTYTVSAFVSDGTNVRSDSITISVANLPTTVSIANPTPGMVVPQGSPVTLRGQADDDYGVASLVWTSAQEPSGILLNGALGTYEFTQIGAQTITLTATDVFGASVSASTTVNVVSPTGAAPTVVLLQPVSNSVLFVPLQDTVHYQLVATATDAEDGVLGDASFSWYVDGVFRGHGAQLVTSHQGPVCTIETHHARVVVVDSDGLESAADVTFFITGDCGG